MESNVIGWAVVLTERIDLRMYKPLLELPPLCVIHAVLQHKVWGKSLSINCFFIDMDRGSEFRVTVYRQKNDNQYLSVDGTLDFKTCPLLSAYKLELAANSKKKIYLKDCHSL